MDRQSTKQKKGSKICFLEDFVKLEMSQGRLWILEQLIVLVDELFIVYHWEFPLSVYFDCATASCDTYLFVHDGVGLFQI